MPRIDGGPCGCCECCGASNEPSLLLILEGCPDGDEEILLLNQAPGLWGAIWTCDTTCSFDVTVECNGGEWTIGIVKDEGIANCNQCNITELTPAESVTCLPLEIDFGMHFMGCDCCDADEEVHVYVTI